MKELIISLLLVVAIISSIFIYQDYVESKTFYIIENVGKRDIKKEWENIKPVLFAFNDHEKVEEIDNDYLSFFTTKDENLKILHREYFKKKLSDLIDASKIKIVNIL